MTKGVIRAAKQKARAKAPRSIAESQFENQAKACGLHGYEREFHFHPERKWRFDFAWPTDKLAVEIEGGVWTGGRHTSGVGFTNDCEKYAEAAVLGWRVIRATTSQVRKGLAINWTARSLGGAPKF